MKFQRRLSGGPKGHKESANPSKNFQKRLSAGISSPSVSRRDGNGTPPKLNRSSQPHSPDPESPSTLEMEHEPAAPAKNPYPKGKQVRDACSLFIFNFFVFRLVQAPKRHQKMTLERYVIQR